MTDLDQLEMDLATYHWSDVASESLLRELVSRLRAAERDAERYQWLRSTGCWEDEVDKIPWRERPDFLWVASSREEVTNNDGENLDAAIDYLIARSKV
ncbi:hypothetical protein [Pseudomonas sp. TMB3-21]